MQDLSHAAWAYPSGSVKTSTSKPNMAKAPEQLHSLSLTEKSWTKDSAAVYAKSLEQPGTLDDTNRVSLVKRNTALPPKPSQDPEATDYKPGVSSQLPKGKAVELALKRLWPPVLYLHSSSETPYLLKETSNGGSQGEDRNLLYYSKLGLVVPSGGTASTNQSTDRSGPLVKRLLRRSLSMDSQVPVYSPSIDLKLSQGSPTAANEAVGIVFRAMSQKSFLKDCSDKKALDYRPHRLRSFSASQSTDREEASPVTEVHIKTKPSSPLSAPSDIIQGTMGAAAAMRDLPLKTEKDQRDISRLPAKKRFQTDRRPPLKKAKANEYGPAISEENCEEDRSAPSSDSNFPDYHLNREKFGELEGMRPKKNLNASIALRFLDQPWVFTAMLTCTIMQRSLMLVTSVTRGFIPTLKCGHIVRPNTA